MEQLSLVRRTFSGIAAPGQSGASPDVSLITIDIYIRITVNIFKFRNSYKSRSKLGFGPEKVQPGVSLPYEHQNMTESHSLVLGSRLFQREVNVLSAHATRFLPMPHLIRWDFWAR